MNVVRFHHPHYNANRVLVNELFNNLLRNDYHADYVGNCAKTPATNVFETEKEFRIEIQLPGFTKEDLKLNYQNGLLTIKVEKEKTENEENYKYARREFGAYNFEKQYKLPKSVDPEKIAARFENGILFIELPKKEEAVEKTPIDIAIS